MTQRNAQDGTVFNRVLQERCKATGTTVRDMEAALLARCVEVAHTLHGHAVDQKEANVFRLASMVIDGRHPAEAQRLRDASAAYFSRHAGDRLLADEVVRRGWVLGLPRLRDMLSREMAAT